ncbi:hypothetical protein DFH09DRAFT_1203790 [Mycena vulgaris]|nr:hypothetical protein DFH09DRAFT_1203790 [Mycena vulgaris]
MNPLQLPELLCEIATHLDSPRDIICLAQSDRLTHGLVLPFLFHDIRIPLDSIASLAAVLRQNPTLVCGCRSFTLLRASGDLSDDEDDTADHEEEEANRTLDAPICADLCTILHALSSHSRLGYLSLIGDARRYLRTDVEFPVGVWRAISAASAHLKALEISVGDTEVDHWRTLMLATIPILRVLNLEMAAHGWECTYVQAFLDRHPALEALTLDLPTCCGPEGITLDSTFPNLKSFAMNAPRLIPEDSTFLERHPKLERLRLDTVQTFSIGGAALQNLRALYITHSMQWCMPAFATATQAPVVQLRLRSQPDLSYPTVAEVVTVVAPTLRCLELDQVDEDAFAVLLVQIRPLLKRAPGLAELAIIGRSSWPKPPTFNAQDLRELLVAIGDAGNLIALRLEDPWKRGASISSPILADLGPLPLALKYIQWNVAATPVTYAIERMNEKNIGSAMECPPFPRAAGDWTAESVLDHLGAGGFSSGTAL